MGRSRSRSRSRSRRRRSPSFSDRSRSPSPDGYRVHVADLGLDPSKREIERHFEKFGPMIEVWVATNPPCFAFVVYKYKDDADMAIREMDGKILSNGRIRCSYARPRTRGRRKGFDASLRCYQCGERGHFSRDCDEIWRQRKKNRDRSNRSRYSRSRSRSRDRRRSRSRSRSRQRNRRSPSRSPRRDRDARTSASPERSGANRKRSRSDRSVSPRRERRSSDRGGGDRRDYDD